MAWPWKRGDATATESDPVSRRGLVAAAVGGAASLLPRQGSAAAGKPNIVLIVADDLDARSLDLALPHLPNIRDLKSQGVAFENFLVTIPTCTPSRASIFRGQYAHNHNVLHNAPPVGGFVRFHDQGHEKSTVATWLRAAGYRTALFGKYFNRYPAGAPRRTFQPPGWSTWFAQTNPGYFDYQINDDGKLVTFGSKPEEYVTDVIARELATFVGKSKTDRKPFFAYLGVKAPHAPATAAPRHRGRFAKAKPPRVPSYNEEDVGDKPGWIQALDRLSAKDEKRIMKAHRRRQRTLLAVDDLIGKLVRTLRDAGQFDRTYVFFTSDNGYHHGEHRIAEGKGTPYEESIRVPLFVRGPNVARGRTEPRLASNMDLAPTFAALAGAKVPDFVDGRSLLPLLRNQNVPWRTCLLVEDIDPSGSPESWVLRMQDRVYIEYPNGERELYDLDSDEFQEENLAGSSSVDDLAPFEHRLEELKTCRADECRVAEDEPFASG